jgi:hypothetical protein
MYAAKQMLAVQTASKEVHFESPHCAEKTGISSEPLMPLARHNPLLNGLIMR